MQSGKRVPPGNYIYMGDVLQDLDILNPGKLIALVTNEAAWMPLATIETMIDWLSRSLSQCSSLVVRRDSRDLEVNHFRALATYPVPCKLSTRWNYPN